jgi:hypothetical protein
VARIVGHFSDTKRIRIARRNHQRRAFAVAKYPSNRYYPRATTTMVRESLVLGRRFLVGVRLRRPSWSRAWGHCQVDGAGVFGCLV